ncbi:MAG TPA: hypothetical protein VFV72_14825 [Candidatus Limnocylindrales bacterium]|nr:hypothetical protein [Candidatus Limnocylindrales bacterium]
MTSAQRARLVVALGVLNLVLATLAFAVGVTAPEPTPNIAVASSAPSPAATPSTSLPEPSARPSNAPSQRPGATSSPLETPEATASPEATPIDVPIGVVIVAERTPTAPPAPTSTTPPAATPEPPTPKPTTGPPPKPSPTAKPPPPKPTPTPKPATKPLKHPPCPNAVDGPPGHNKGDSKGTPCGKGGDKGHNAKGGKGNVQGGVVIVLPLTVSAALLGGRRRVAAGAPVSSAEVIASPPVRAVGSAPGRRASAPGGPDAREEPRWPTS